MNTVKILVPVLVLAGLLMIAACSSPAVTGIKVHIQNGEYQDAIHLADSVIAGAEAENPEVWYWRGRAYSFMMDWEGSAESFKTAYELDPSYASSIINYWPSFYNAAANYVEADRIDEAVAMLETGMEIVPERPEFDQMLGQIALNAGEKQVALEHFLKSVDLAEVRIATLQERYAAETDPVLQEQIGEQLDRNISTVVLSSYNAGAILKNFYFATEDEAEKAALVEQAIAVFNRGIEADPSNADLMTGLAEIYILEEMYSEALAIYDNALIAIDQSLEDGWISPEDATAMRANVLLTRGFTFIEMERYDEGIQALEECRVTLGDTYQVLAMIGHANFVMENYDESLDIMTQLTQMDGLTAEEYANAWYMMYANYIRLERDNDALQAIQAAIQYDGDNADYYEFLAQTYSTLGRNAQAMEAMEKAQSLRNQ
ncbi:MAG TPA: tetratricopeptide repeat protein [Candidatus Sabulitectum sp.]|nr:tetratricopeptide repeat protein [Candidatus Sabulitectum sp.]HPF33502.1 tetratricopeptide repeat protein [Candidatus Sabulitectum sp.]HPR21829.1 tetratricopeptide repeat protein [Candidatus Sabulitectum sp.]